jgi:hypothetical protein
MSCIVRPLAGALALVLFWSSAAAVAQTPPVPGRISGTIEKADETGVLIRAHDGGATYQVDLTPNVTVFAVSKGTLADLKPGAFLGVGGMPQPDGTQRAIQVTVFSESQRGTGEGFRPWDRGPTSTMTNATVADTVGSVDGQVLTMKYSGGEQKIVVPPDAIILAYSAGERSELKAGAKVAILRPKAKPNGGLEADRINVGRGDVVPR